MPLAYGDGHHRRAPGLSTRRGRLRRQPPRHGAGRRAGRLRPPPGGADQRPPQGRARAGPSTPTCSTTPTVRWSTTSSCGGSTTSVFDVMPNASNTDRVVDAIGGEDTTADAGRHRRPGPRRPRRAGRGVARGRRRAPVRRRRASTGRAPPAWPPAPATPVRTAFEVRRAGRRAPTSCWRGRRWRRASPRPDWARATPCASRRRCPSTGTSSAPASPRCRPGSGWVVGWDKADFRGRAALAAERDGASARRLVGLATEGRQPPREGADVVDGGTPVGTVTSGNFSPMLGARDRPGPGRLGGRRGAGHGRSSSSSGARCARRPSWPTPFVRAGQWADPE